MENRELLLETMVNLSLSASMIENFKSIKEFYLLCVERGFNEESLIKISDFMDEITYTEEYDKYLFEKSVDMYFDNLKKIESYMNMARGYQEMGDLEQTEDELWVKEGEKLDEVDTKES